MPNIPDSRAPSSAGFSLPDENFDAVSDGLNSLSKTLAKKIPKQPEEEASVDKETSPEKKTSPDTNVDETFVEGFKADLTDASKFLQEKLRDVDVYEELSEFTSGIYQTVRDQLGFTEKSPDKINQEVSTAYAEKKSEILARQEFDNSETANIFSRKLDEKIGYDREALGAFQKQALTEKIHATVDRHIEKYNSGVEADPSTLTDAIVVIDSSINDLAPGIGRDAAVEKSAQARKSLLSFALQGHAKQGNYGALQTLLDGIDPATGARINIDRYVGGVDKAYFQDLATKGLLQEGAVRFLDDMAVAGLSGEEQFQEMSLHPDSDLANEALSLFKSQERKRARAQREAIRTNRYTAWGGILETGENAEITDIPLDADENLRRDIETHIERGPARDDFTRKKGTQALYEINSLRVSDLEAFQRLDLSHYFKDLSRKQIGQVMAMQQSEPDAYETAHFKLRDRLALRTWKEVTGRNGRDELETANFADFRTRFDERIEEYEQLHKKQAGPFDVEEIANTMRDDGEVVEFGVEGVIFGGSGSDFFVGDAGEFSEEIENDSDVSDQESRSEDTVKTDLLTEEILAIGDAGTLLHQSSNEVDRHSSYSSDSHAWYNSMMHLMMTDKKRYDALPLEDRATNERYWAHNRGGVRYLSNPSTHNAAINNTPEHQHNSLRAGGLQRSIFEEVDWEEGLTRHFINAGMNENVAKTAVFIVSLTPAGTVLDIGEGLVNASLALEKNDVKGALGYLGTAGLSALKVGKIGNLVKKGGLKMQRALVKAMPDVIAATMARQLVNQGLKSKVVGDSIARGLKNGFKPAEALAYGVFSANANTTIDAAMKSFKGVVSRQTFKKLSLEKQNIIRQKIQSKMYRDGEKFLKGVTGEAKSKAVEFLMDDWFESSNLH
ncbi:MAG: hypothetical protein V7776_21895 [Halopseudomonas aestusnigri]